MEIKQILSKYKNIAVVGLSKNPEKDSYIVAEYLKNKGYKIIPVNPTAQEILGEKCYKSLEDLPENLKKSLEIVDIFRPSQDIEPIVEQAIQLKKEFRKPYVVWMQLGIVNLEAAKKAEEAGMVVIMDKCIMREHKKLV